MSKTFTKGEQVTLISSWDNKGTVTFRDAVVYSCGKKQMVLTDAVSGEEIGRHFVPERGSLDTVSAFNWQGVWPRLDRAQAEALCLEAGAKIVAAVREGLQQRRERWPDDAGYLAALAKTETELHEPCAMPWPAR